MVGRGDGLRNLKFNPLFADVVKGVDFRQRVWGCGAGLDLVRFGGRCRSHRSMAVCLGQYERSWLAASKTTAPYSTNTA